MNRLARILITGPRTWTDCASLGDALLNTWHDATQEGYDSILVTHGTAEGADTLSDDWARAAGVPRDPHPADWAGPCAPNCPPGHRRPRGQGDYCPFAGHRRNDLMVRLRPVLCVACISPCNRS